MALVPLPGFLGPSNHLASVTADAELLINWFYEPIGPGTNSHNDGWYVPTPGLTPFVVLADGPVRALFSQDGRCFAVGSTGFYEVFASQTTTNRGTVVADGRPATISSNGTAGNQLFVTSGGHGYIYGLTTNVLTEVADGDLLTPTAMGAFCDGYFLSLERSSRTWQFSALEDGTDWDPLDVNQVSTSTDNILALMVSHRDVWLFGSQTSQVWADVGELNTPFSPIPGSLMQQGIVGPFACAQIDNVPLWVSANDQGAAMVFRANGYTPQRISTHAVETALSQFSNLSMVVAWTYQERGHSFLLLYVPGSDSTWVYDVSTNFWHERRLWNPTTLKWEAHRGRCQTFCYNKHLVGDRLSGVIYTMGLDVYTDGLIVFD